MCVLANKLFVITLKRTIVNKFHRFHIICQDIKANFTNMRTAKIDSLVSNNTVQRDKRLIYWASFYYYGLTLIPAWISNYVHFKMWDEITYPFLNFNGTTIKV